MKLTPDVNAMCNSAHLKNKNIDEYFFSLCAANWKLRLLARKILIIEVFI